jgi:hypothetical protein
MFFSVMSQIGLIYADNLTHATFYMFILGLTWPGKRITGLNYALEFIPLEKQQVYLQAFSLFDYPSILVASLYYEYVDRSWLP